MKVKLGDVCDRGSSNLKQSDIVDTVGDYPIYGASGHIGNANFYHQEKAYVAIVKDGAGIGRATLNPAKSSIIGTMQYLLPKGNILAEYLYYVVKYMHLEKYFTGATIPHIYFKDYKNEEFNLDTIDKQYKVVDTLNKCENIIKLRQKELKKLDDLMKARFVELFGDPVSNNKNWNWLTLGEIAEISSSKRVFEKDYVARGIPFFRTKEIVELSEGNKISTELFITNEHFEKLKQSYGVPKKGDLLISAVGTIGKIWVVSGDFDFYFKDGNLLQIKSSPSFNSVYMKWLLNELILNYKQQMSTGTAYSALTITGLKNMLVYDVPIELQNQFANFVNQVDKSKVVVQKALEETQLLFDSLMQEYFG